MISYDFLKDVPLTSEEEEMLPEDMDANPDRVPTYSVLSSEDEAKLRALEDFSEVEEDYLDYWESTKDRLMSDDVIDN